MDVNDADRLTVLDDEQGREGMFAHVHHRQRLFGELVRVDGFGEKIIFTFQ